MSACTDGLDGDSVMDIRLSIRVQLLADKFEYALEGPAVQLCSAGPPCANASWVSNRGFADNPVAATC